MQVNFSQGEINYEMQTDERENINSKHQMIFSKLDFLIMRKLQIKARELSYRFILNEAFTFPKS